MNKEYEIMNKVFMIKYMMDLLVSQTKASTPKKVAGDLYRGTTQRIDEREKNLVDNLEYIQKCANELCELISE